MTYSAVHARNLVWDGTDWVPEAQPGGSASPFGAPIPAEGTIVGGENPSGNFVPFQFDVAGNLLVSSSGGGGGAVTIADGADVAEGATTDVSVGDSTGTVNAHIRYLVKVQADVWDAVNHRLNVFVENTTLAVTQSGSWVLSAGSAIIGNVRIDQTTPGTTNGVQVNAALPAGANVIGQVTANAGTNLNTSALALEAGHLATIDTSTAAVAAVSGTTAGTAVITDVNATIQQYLRGIVKLAITAGGWLVTASLAAGSNLIGKVGIDQTTPGTTNAVAIISGQAGVAGGTGVDGATVQRVSLATNVGLPAGTQLLGKTGIDQTTPGTTNAIAGDVAAAATDSSNPVKIGGKAASAAPSAVTAGQRANALFDLWGRLFTRTGAQAPVASTFTQIHVPASNTQATKTQASAGSGKRNVCTGFTITLTANGTAPAVTTPVVVSVIDGASGGTTYLWRSNINMPAQAGGIVSINRSGLWLVGTQATGLTVEFSGASGANTYQSVAFDGVIVEE